MTEKIAWVFPGQGSQAVGMGKALAEHSAAAREVFAEADEALGESLSSLCFEGPLPALTLTANTQPAILTCSIAALRAAQAELSGTSALTPAVVLGHSLGEWSALVAADAIDFADAVRLVRLRGEAMQAATPAGMGAMAAVIGVASDDLERMCAEAAGDEVLSPANENGGGQIVVAGHAGAVDRLVALVKSQKARAIPLKVSAPFHCALMQPAAERLSAALADIEIRAPQVPVVSNVDAEPNSDPSRIRTLLVEQVTRRVRWEASIARVASLGIRRALEFGHGKVLAGLIRRIDKEFRVDGVSSPDDIDVLKGGSDGANGGQ